MERKGWTADELAVLREFYPKEGIAVKNRLNGRTESQIYGAAWHYGIKNEHRKKRDKNTRPMRRYQPEEIQYICDHINCEDIESIASHLGRTPGAVRSAASKHHLSAEKSVPQKPWTDEEKEILKEYFPSEGIHVTERLPERSHAAVYAEADHLGISKRKRVRKSSNSSWTKEEDAVLRKYYEEKGADACCSLLEGRSRQAVIIRANRFLKLKSRNAQNQ